jgi:uncharacterized phage protein gp47/JayE
MPWPLPQPADITDRAAGVIESEYARVYALRNPGAPPVQPDARSPNSLLAVDARVAADVTFDLYLYQSRLAKELMPDTAVDWLGRQGTIWGVPQGQPIEASGTVVAVGDIGTVIPMDFPATAPGNAIYQSTGTGTIGATGTLSVAFAAEVGGAAGNLVSGVVLTPVSPLGALTSLTVDANGLTGGQDIESTDSWRARILRRIQQRGSGGNESDWEQWAQEALPACIAHASSPGPGQVTVAIAMPGSPTPVAATTAQVATVQAYISNASARKPLGTTPTAIAATLTPIAWTIHLNPDTPAIRLAATAALELWFASDAGMESTLEISRGDAALSDADGEFSHDRTAPTADYTAGVAELPILGAVTFV